MDFYEISMKVYPTKKIVEVYPNFLIFQSKDLMIRGSSFYAFYNYETGFWSTNEFELISEKVYNSLFNQKSNNSNDKYFRKFYFSSNYIFFEIPGSVNKEKSDFYILDMYFANYFQQPNYRANNQ